MWDVCHLFLYGHACLASSNNLVLRDGTGSHLQAAGKIPGYWDDMVMGVVWPICNHQN